MRVNHNIPSLFSYNALSSTNSALQKTIERLSTGLRINSASDDAAGLAISEKMRAQIKGLDRAINNAQDGISMIQTAEGAMNEVHSILQRMRELSVQSANDTLTQEDRGYIQVEVEQLKEEIDRIANTTQFNKKKLLNGSADAEWSTSLHGTKVFINGSVMSKDQFGQTEIFEGNFNVKAHVAQTGSNQVLKSNIFTHMLPNGTGMVAGINSNLSSIANFYDKNGVFVLDDAKELTFSFADGSSSTVQIYASDTVGTLGEKLSRAMAAASGIQMGDGAGVQYVSDGMAPPNMDDPILEGLATNWLWGAAKRIKEEYGLTGDGRELQIRIIEGTPGGAGARAGVTNGQPFIEIERVDVAPMGELADTGMAHELTHVLAFMDTNISNAILGAGGLWLVEGLATYMEGYNGNVQYQQQQGALSPTNMNTIMNKLLTLDYAGGYDNTLSDGQNVREDGYASSYLAVRYFDEVSIASGGTGIKGLLASLKNDPNIDNAIAAAGGSAFGDMTDFKNAIISGTGITSAFQTFVDKVSAEDYSIDTGGIGGSYASGNSPLSPSARIEGNGTFSLNPIAEFGWSGVKWPTDVGGFSLPTPSVLPVADPKSGSLQAVNGTLLLHSNILGDAGRITISGDENLLKALGFAEIQSARNTVYDLSITDAHSGKLVKSGVKISGNVIYGELHGNIDIALTNNFGMDADPAALRENGYGTFAFNENGRDSFTVHIAANSVVFQIGANEGEDINVSFGSVSASALGVNAVNLRDRESAARSITVIDNAISKVSTKRARLGAYQNRLEHTITNLTTASTNTTAAESRIRDADMAKEMMEFTKLNILSQAGNSMLAQANQLPQGMLMLLRG